MENKRHFKRLGIISGIEVATVGKKKKLQGYVANISRGGVAIYITGPLKPKSLVELKLVFLDDEGTKWSEAVKGKVKWIRKKFVAVAGVEFDELSEERQPTLMTVLTQVEKK